VKILTACLAALAAFPLASGQAIAKAERVNLNWEFEEVVDPLTDERRGYISNTGDGGLFVIKCDKPGAKNTYYQLITDEYLGGRFEMRFMDWRVDKGYPVREMWSYRKNYAINDTSGALINQITDGTRLFMRAMKYDGSFVDAQFDLTGFGQAFLKLAAVCKLG
jgi:hypothetical protein